MNKKQEKNNQSIVYVNFTPYENSGYILDFLKENFKIVTLFSFNFHRVSQGQFPSSITIYSHGNIIKQIRLFQIPTVESLAFILLPIRSLIIFIEILYYLIRLKTIVPVYDVFFTVNGFIAWTGIIMKQIGLVNKTVFWVWDYYPQTHENIAIHIMRSLYWQFDKVAINSDRVVFMNDILRSFHTNIRHIDSSRFSIIGIGTLPHRSQPKNLSTHLDLAFLGTIKRSQGLDMVFDCADSLVTAFPNIRLFVFGGGPDEEYFKIRAAHSPLPVTFYGYIDDTDKLQRLIRRTTIGIALYKPDPSNVSYFGDPSKIKAYLSESLPVITTTSFEFSKEIDKSNSGVIINYGNTKELVNAIKSIVERYPSYSEHASKLAQRYYYREIYPHMFESSMMQKL